MPLLPEIRQKIDQIRDYLFIQRLLYSADGSGYPGQTVLKAPACYRLLPFE